MEKNNYVTIYEEYQHKFFQLPQVFFVSEKYKDMSNNAKVAWAILRDRSSLSRKNKWFDTDTGRVYFIFKNEELMKLLNINSEATLVKVKKELISAGLVEQFRQGFNRPNKMYLLYPEIVIEDIHKIDEFENYTTEPDGTVFQNNEENGSPLEPQGTLKNEAPKNEVPELQKMKSSNTESNNTEVLKDLDTKDTKDTDMTSNNNAELSEIERRKKRKELLDQAYKENSLKIPFEISDILNVVCTTDSERDENYKVMISAKKNAEKYLDFPLFFEEEETLAYEMRLAFLRAVRKIEHSKDIKNPSGYIYKSIYDTLTSKYKHRMTNEKFPINEVSDLQNDVKFYNWLEDRS